MIDFKPEDDSPFKPLGEILWNSYCFTISPQGRVHPKIGLIDKLNSVHQSRISTFFKKYIDKELNASHVKKALANNLIDF